MTRSLRAAVPFLAGVLFAVGLGLAEMTNPAKVIGFLDVFGAWDPSLVFVMGGALLVHLPFVQWLRRRRPAIARADRTKVDRPLVIGAAIFGVGWGLSGFCPGPAFVALAGGTAGALVFVTAFFVGMALALRRSRQPAAGSACEPTGLPAR